MAKKILQNIFAGFCLFANSGCAGIEKKDFIDDFRDYTVDINNVIDGELKLGGFEKSNNLNSSVNNGKSSELRWWEFDDNNKDKDCEKYKTYKERRYGTKYYNTQERLEGYRGQVKTKGF
ncbi:MAG: hypothetical protein AABX30_03575 [Nanoarchaeota archaeon]